MLRKYWFYSVSLLHVVFDLAQLGFFLGSVIWALVRRLSISIDWNSLGLPFSFLILGSINGIFLLTYGFIHTNTKFGTFLFQQAVRLGLMALYTASALWTYFTYGYFPQSLFDIFFLTSGCMHAATWISLWVLFVIARFSGDPLLGQWTVNVEDLASRAQPLPHRVTLRGIRRPNCKKSRRVRALRAMKRFTANALFRRVRPIETRFYAFCQHLFALGAIVLLLTRTIIFLAQLDNEKLPSRVMVGPCWDSSDWDGISILVRHPNQRRLTKDEVPNASNTTFQISIAFRDDEYAAVYNTTELCYGQLIKTNQADGDYMDWFWHYTCDDNALSRQRNLGGTSKSHTGFEYTIISRLGSNDSRAYDLPSIWLVQGMQTPNLLTPYLTPPLIPAPNAHTVYATHYSQRKFISSSPLRDAITGSKPEYSITRLYPPTLLYSNPIASSGRSTSDAYSSGFIRWPKFLDSSLQTPRSDLIQGFRGPDDMCEVIEEYRVGNTFDILASIGGLLALLQGLHIFLFGRPLFWGLFGAKLITPFGFVGRFATRGFRERLQDHYGIPDSLNASTAGGSAEQFHNNIRMTQFLLDYVLDMGPAAPQAPNRNTDEDSELPRERTEGDINKPLMSVSREQSVTDKHLPLSLFDLSDIYLTSYAKTEGQTARDIVQAGPKAAIDRQGEAASGEEYPQGSKHVPG